MNISYNKWYCSICELSVLEKNRDRHFESGKHQAKARKLTSSGEKYVINNNLADEFTEEPMPMTVSHEDTLPDMPSNLQVQQVDDLDSSPTIEILVHLFCTQKNISLANERLLFKILALPLFQNNYVISTFNAFQKNLAAVQSLSSRIIVTQFKHPKQKNYKPQDPNKQGKRCEVPVYDIKEHLEMFLRDPALSASVVISPEYDGNQFTTFTTGQYFADLCSNLPQGTVPLCRK
jgi:hypothetical protein